MMRRALQRQNFAVAAALAAVDHLLIFAALALAAYLSSRSFGFVPFAGVVLATLAIGRSLRGLECLVHEASHYNWSKRNKRANDGAADMLAALPVFSRVRHYRRSHQLHHSQYGTNSDPDLARHKMFRSDDSAHLTIAATLGKLSRTLFVYQCEWFGRIGSSKSLFAIGAVYHVGHTVAAAAAVAAVTGHSLAGLLVRTSLVMCASVLVVWPSIRFVGESSEHVYSWAAPEGTRRYLVSTTVSNIGWLQRLLFHPHGDAFHSAHHLFPFVPGWHLARVDARMSLGWGLRKLALYRQRLWELPRQRRLLPQRRVRRALSVSNGPISR